MAGALIFSRAPSGAALVFGAQDGATSGAVVTVAADFEPLQARVVVAAPMRAVVAASFEDFTGVVVASYDINVDRPLASGARAHWQNAETMQAPVSAAWQDAARMVSGADARWTEAAAIEEQIQITWQDADHLQQTLSARYQDALRLPLQPQRAAWQDATRLRYSAETAWQDADPRRAEVVSSWQDADRTARLWLDAHWQDATPMRAGYTARAGSGTALSSAWYVRWQDGIVPPPGRQDRPGGEVPVTPRTPDATLVFHKPANTGSAALVFNWSADSKETFLVPTKRTYIVFDSVTLTRVDNGAEVGIYALDISIDRDSWTCSWSADVDRAEWVGLAADDGKPLALEAEINGYVWRLTAEGAPSRSRAFGSEALKIKGRGRACELASAYTPISTWYNATAKTAQQLAAMALTYNGVSIGWELDWQIDDWLVPAKLWSFRGAPVDGVLDVASTVRAVVQADPAARVLHVLPRYPAAPWNWGSLTPDIEIPLAALDADSLEPIVKPEYNAVYISGQTQGVVAHVVRSGTAGDLVAPLITHPLMCAEVAGRQRGIVELGDTGRQARVSITMDVSADAPLLQVGQLAAFSEAADPWRGLVTGVSVSARMEGDALVVSQSAEIERHYA